MEGRTRRKDWGCREMFESNSGLGEVALAVRRKVASPGDGWCYHGCYKVSGFPVPIAGKKVGVRDFGGTLGFVARERVWGANVDSLPECQSTHISLRQPVSGRDSVGGAADSRPAGRIALWIPLSRRVALGTSTKGSPRGKPRFQTPLSRQGGRNWGMRERLGRSSRTPALHR